MALKLTLRSRCFGFPLAESRRVIDLCDPVGGNRKQRDTFLAKVQEHCAQLEQHLQDLPQALDCSASWPPPRSRDQLGLFT